MEIRALLGQVIGSWQVIAAAFVLIVYFKLVTYVANVRRRRRPRPLPKIRRSKAKSAGTHEETFTDDLGLEDNSK
jgi:hypothetical protein